MSELVKQQAVEAQLKLGPVATRRLLNRLERERRITVIRPNCRVRRFDLDEVLRALKSPKSAEHTAA